jgi:hypothetical protein
MSFEEDERSWCAAILRGFRDCNPEGDLMLEMLIKQRALAREQQVSITTYALREREIAKADLVTAQAKLAAIEVLCSEAETDSDAPKPWEDENGDCWVLCADVRKILGGGT